LSSDAFKWVLLRHELPDGSWHYDWLLSRPDAPEQGLLSFRVFCDPISAVERFEAIPTPDHRRVYLTYEGEVSGGRGTVRRVGEGSVARISRCQDLLEIVVSEPVSVTLYGRADGPNWVFDRHRS
jgi:hypothetical protein